MTNINTTTIEGPDNAFTEVLTEIVEDTPTISIEEIVTDLVAAIDSEIVGPYAIHKIINTVFEVAGSDKRKPPQYMYNYSRNGMIAKRAEKPNYDHQYTKDEVIAFVTKFVTKQIG